MVCSWWLKQQWKLSTSNAKKADWIFKSHHVWMTQPTNTLLLDYEQNVKGSMVQFVKAAFQGTCVSRWVNTILNHITSSLSVLFHKVRGQHRLQHIIREAVFKVQNPYSRRHVCMWLNCIVFQSASNIRVFEWEKEIIYNEWRKYHLRLSLVLLVTQIKSHCCPSKITKPGSCISESTQPFRRCYRHSEQGGEV